MSQRINLSAQNCFRSIAIFFCLMVTTSLCFAHETDEVKNPGSPPVIFSKSLPDVPGKQLTVVELNLKPRDPNWQSHPHRHPGSVYIYVTKGTVRWAIEDQPAQTLHAGDSFFEPAGVLHTLSENASTSEPASVIAVMLVPDGSPLVLPEE